VDRRHTACACSSDLYKILVAQPSATLGSGSATASPRAPGPAHFERGHAALASLGISPRESEVLELLAQRCPRR